MKQEVWKRYHSPRRAMVSHVGSPAGRNRSWRACLIVVIVIAALPPGTAAATTSAKAQFVIRVVDEATGRGVPLVELTTTAQQRFYTDSNGIAVIRAPELIGRKVFFHVRSHGYGYPKDGFGYHGRSLNVEAGGEATLRVQRENVAERLYRVTGSGIYRDSYLAGAKIPIDKPLLNAQVTGSDSVLTAIYQGKIHWFWGDTNRLRYPLGNFQVTGATSALPGEGGLDPSAGVNLEYFAGPDGFARPMAAIPGKGLTWLSGLVVLRPPETRERMFAHYVKVDASPSGWDVYDRGLAEYNDNTNQFHRVASFPSEDPFPDGAHPVLRDGPHGSYVYYCDPYPIVRVPAIPEDMKRQECYESFTCLQPGTTGRDVDAYDRDPNGRLRYAWRANARVPDYDQLAKLAARGEIPQDDNWFVLRDVATGKPLHAHRGSVYRNAYRDRWIMITCETGGTSMLGEIWYAEADHLLGPWVYARKIVTHDHYSFYNPKQHPMFDQEGGRVIFFEGTYTRTFSGAAVATPHYDYNQIMYRLALDDARLFLPVPVYRVVGPGANRSRYMLKTDIDARSHWADVKDVAFFVLPPERRLPESVPVYVVVRGQQEVLTLARPDSTPAAPRFYGMPVGETKGPSSTDLVPLYGYVHDGTGRRRYLADPDWAGPGWTRDAEPVCRVWRNPLAIPVWRIH